MNFDPRDRDFFPVGAQSPSPSRRAVLRGLSALLPLGLLGHALPATAQPARIRRGDAARGIFHVDDFGARGDCNTNTGTGTDDTAAINAAIRAVQARGGGLVVFHPEKAYRLSDPFKRTPDSMGGPSIHLRPGVSLDGQGCTLYQSAPASFIGNRPDYRDFATVMGDIDPGSTTISVDFPSLFAVGDNVLMRLGDNGYIPIEPDVAMIATVVAVSGEGLTIDRPVPKWIEVGKTTVSNKRVYKLGELLDGIGVRNFNFDTPENGVPEAGFSVTVGRRLSVENLRSHGDIGAGIILAQFVEDSQFSRLVVMRNLNRNRHPSMGRAITFSNATNCKVSHIVARDLAQCFSFTESHSKGIEVSNAWIDYRENSDAQTILFTAEESSVAYDNIHIRARNRVNLHDTGGTPAAYSFRNLTLKTSTYPKAMPTVNHFLENLHLEIDEEKFLYDLKNPRVHEIDVPLKGGMYHDYAIPAGLVLSYDTWLSAQTDPSLITGVYFGSASNNGIDIRADFIPGQWRKTSASPGPGADSNIYGNLRRLREERKILVVTAKSDADFSGARLRIRLSVAPRQSA